MDEPVEQVIIFEAPKIEPPEFRLYYSDTGDVICYTSSKREEGGNYIVIDARTYAEARPDIKIIDGKISTAKPNAVVYKLMPSDDGTACVSEDVSIIAPSNFTGDTTNWKLKIYEL